MHPGTPRFLPSIKVINILIALLIFLTITDKLLFNYAPFWGLENEDAYIYADTARFMTYNYPWSIDPFVTKSISGGSLTQPFETISYATHSEGFSILIYFIHKIFGYWNHTPLLMSSISAIISFLILIVIALKHVDSPRERVMLCIIAFLTSPLARSFQSSGVSEAISSLSVLVTMIAFIRITSINKEIDKRNLLVVVSILAYSTAVLIKRENLILILLPFLAVINFPSLLKDRKFLSALIGVVISTLFYLFLIPPIKSFSSESSDIGTSAFSIYHFICNAPKFMECILRIDMWGLTGYMLFASIIYSRRQLRDPSIQFPLIIFVLYILAYTFHFRSCFQVQSGNVDAFEMMRFSTNIFPIAVLLISSARIPKVTYSKRLIASFSGVGLLMLFYSSYQKIHLSQIECIERIEPIKRAISLCGPNSILVTDVTSLARIYGKDNLDIIRTSSLSSVIRDTNILSRAGEFIVINRPKEFESINNIFNNNGLALANHIQLFSNDINVYKVRK